MQKIRFCRFCMAPAE